MKNFEFNKQYDWDRHFNPNTKINGLNIFRHCIVKEV